MPLKVMGGKFIRRRMNLDVHVTPDVFDRVLRTVSEVIGESTSLSLDSKIDRDILKKKIWFALGAET